MLCAAQIFLVVLLATGPSWSRDDATVEASRFESMEWTTSSTLKMINDSVLKDLKSRLGRDDRIAEIGQDFRSTDVDVDGLPFRRLVVSGKAKGLWFVCFEQGGRGHHLVLVMYRVEANAVQLVLLARGDAGDHNGPLGWKASVSQLKAAFRTGRFSIDNPEFYLSKKRE